MWESNLLSLQEEVCSAGKKAGNKSKKLPKTFKEYIAVLMDKRLDLKAAFNQITALPQSKTQELMATIISNAQVILEQINASFEDAYLSQVTTEGMDDLWASAADKLVGVDKDRLINIISNA